MFHTVCLGHMCPPVKGVTRGSEKVMLVAEVGAHDGPLCDLRDDQ